MAIKKYFLFFALAAAIFSGNICVAADLQSPQIISVRPERFSDKGMYVDGTAYPYINVVATILAENGNEIYSVKTKSDGTGKWQAVFDQPLKSGNYKVQAVARDNNGLASKPAISEKIYIKGPFSFIIGVFSVLVLVLLAIFCLLWIMNELAEAKRGRRILMAQRDILASYNVIKKDVDLALKSLEQENFDKTNLKYLLDRVEGNLDNMNKYVAKGIEIIGNYDIIAKLNNKFKFFKDKK